VDRLSPALRVPPALQVQQVLQTRLAQRPATVSPQTT
jgi:hypothetical protein